MRANRLRLYLISVLALAAVLSVAGKKTNSPFVGWLSLAAFLCALSLYVTWRRAAIKERRGRVSASEAKTDEARTRTDQ